MSINPYAPPAEVETWPSPVVDGSASLVIAVLRWTVICGVCAAPTLFVALGMFNEPGQLAAIACVSTLFVAGFVLLERMVYPRLRERWPGLRTALRVGFITRISISILFPIGLAIDMVNGLLSLGIIDLVLSRNTFDDDDIGGMFPPLHSGSWGVFGLTFVDGLLMIGEVAAFSAAVYFVLWITQPRSRIRTEQDDCILR